jgi:hypothetical protein
MRLKPDETANPPGFSKPNEKLRIVSCAYSPSDFRPTISLDDDHPEPLGRRMITRLMVTFVGLAIGFVSTTSAQQKDTVDPQIAVQIRALASKYDAAFNRSDAATVVTLYTEDVVFKTPNGTFNGRSAVEELFARHYFAESQLSDCEDKLSGTSGARPPDIHRSRFAHRSAGRKSQRNPRPRPGGDAIYTGGTTWNHRWLRLFTILRRYFDSSTTRETAFAKIPSRVEGTALARDDDAHSINADAHFMQGARKAESMHKTKRECQNWRAVSTQEQLLMTLDFIVLASSSPTVDSTDFKKYALWSWGGAERQAER